MNEMQTLSIAELLKKAKSETCATKAADYASDAFNRILLKDPYDNDRAREALESLITQASLIQVTQQKWDRLTNAFLFAQSIKADDLAKKATRNLIRCTDSFCTKADKNNRFFHLELIRDSYIDPDWATEQALLRQKWVQLHAPPRSNAPQEGRIKRFFTNVSTFFL